MRTSTSIFGDRFAVGAIAVALMIISGPVAGEAAEVTLEDALDAPAADLAQGYAYAAYMLNEIIPLAEAGVTIHSADGVITRESAAAFRTQFESRLALYEDAIQQRGFAMLAGSYHLASISKSCAKARSDWAALVAGNEFIDLQMSQSGFEGAMNSRFRLEGTVKSFPSSIVVVETAIYFTDFMNGDYGWTGNVSQAGMEVWPLPDVVDNWPDWAAPPRRKDLENCLIGFVPGPEQDPMN